MYPLDAREYLLQKKQQPLHKNERAVLTINHAY
jgi:hypothetical protein